MGIASAENNRACWLAAQILPLEPAIRAWLRRVAPVGVDADDLIQEAYAKIAGLPSIDHITQPKPYLFRVVKSLILEYVRHAQVIPIETMAELDDLNVPAEEASPERILLGRQQLERLAQAIERLPPGCREVFRLRKFDDLSQKEIAQALGISENTVEKQLARALRLLFAMLTEDETGSVRISVAGRASKSSQHAKT